MKQIKLTLVDGQVFYVNYDEITEMHQINHEDIEANTRIVLRNGKELCVMETCEEIIGKY